MSKKTTPLHLQLRALPKCPTCAGSGKIKPMFYEQVCDSCDGAGLTDENGEKLRDWEALIQLRMRITALREENGKLRQRVTQLAPYAPGPSGDDILRPNAGRHNWTGD